MTARRPRFIPPDLRTGSEEQAAVLRVLRASGWKAYSTSDPHMRRASAGVPDIIAFRLNRVLFWETKTGKGELTEEQEMFLQAADKAGAEVGWGNSDACLRWLMKRVEVA
jgi:Holliday junction resolvase